MKYLLGIDIGSTKCAVILGEYSSEESATPRIIDKIKFPTEASKGPDYTLSVLFNQLDNLLERNNLKNDNIERIGISCGGPLDSDKGIIKSPPNLIGWDNIEIVKMLKDKYGIDAKMRNDADACALAEWKFGAGKGYKDLIFLTFGTGMGAGLILNNNLYTGACDMAGEIGHVRLENYGPIGYGKSGSFEGFCSGGGIAQLAKMKIYEKWQNGEKVSMCKDMQSLDNITAEVVAKVAEKGDKLAEEIYSICGEYLGRGLSILIDILNPEVIIIGSIYTKSQNLLYNYAMRVVDRETLSYSKNICKILPSGLGDSVGDYASLAVATEKKK